MGDKPRDLVQGTLDMLILKTLALDLQPAIVHHDLCFTGHSRNEGLRPCKRRV
jgi:hypothetical protein